MAVKAATQRMAFCLLLLFNSESARAQTCVDPSAMRAPILLGASITRHAYATAYEANVNVVGRWQASSGVGTLRDHDLRENAAFMHAEGMRLVPVGSKRRFFFCPSIGLAAQFGPQYELLTPDDNVRIVAWGAGLQGAYTLPSTDALRISFVGRFQAWRATSHKYHLGSQLFSISDTYGELRGGVRIVYKRRLMITPEFGTMFGLVPAGIGYDDLAPFGRESGELTLSVSATVSLGR